jgi:hypothetical protein
MTKYKMAADTKAQIIETKTVERLKDSSAWQDRAEKNFSKEFNELDKLKYRDISARLRNRENFRKYLMTLLSAQNIAVFGFVFYALYLNRLEPLQFILSTLVGATLLETTALIYIIVKFLFSDIPYQANPPQPTPLPTPTN